MWKEKKKGKKKTKTAILSKGEKEWIKLGLNWSVFLGNVKICFSKRYVSIQKKRRLLQPAKTKSGEWLAISFAEKGMIIYPCSHNNNVMLL